LSARLEAQRAKAKTRTGLAVVVSHPSHNRGKGRALAFVVWARRAETRVGYPPLGVTPKVVLTKVVLTLITSGIPLT